MNVIPRYSVSKVAHFLKTLVVLGILLDAVVMGVETDPRLRSSFSSLLEGLDIFCMVLFCVECTARVIVKAHRFSAQNICNTVLLLLSVIARADSSYWLFRIFRALRILRVVFYIPGLQYLVLILRQGVKAAAYVIIMLFFILFVFAIAGVEYFRHIDPENWGNLRAALISTLSVFTISGWVDHNTRLTGFGSVHHQAFFFIAIIIGNFIFLNMFLGLVMEASKHMKIEKKEEAKRKRKIKEQEEEELQLQTSAKYFHQLRLKYEQCEDEFIEPTELCTTLTWIDLHETSVKRQKEEMKKLKQLSDQTLRIQQELLEMELQEKRHLKRFREVRAVGAVGFTAMKFLKRKQHN
ncbi:cation channel sperm-associated protein 3 [Astyanax mexicanus]|uniref:Cation channel sperm associated 3 n=1 Tax=Astyanax mexicanus TaxID=7994 RepID=A0A3B1JNE0_ASTMX|nr:cation channel sperm-associated protein 3 [Astyanax mexicanus]